MLVQLPITVALCAIALTAALCIYLYAHEIKLPREAIANQNLARYFISTFRDEGFIDDEIIEIFNSDKLSNYYGIDKSDKSAVSIALSLLAKESID